MPIQRECTNCGTAYPDTATLCINCSDVPASLVKDTVLNATLKIDFGPNTQVVGTEVYKIVKMLGFGAMATAYLVTDQSGDRFVVKEMLPNAKPKTQLRLLGYFRREASLMAEVGQNIITNPPLFPPAPIGYGYFEDHNRIFMAMEFMEGTDLEKLQEQIGGPMTMLDSLQFAMEICIVLRDYLHGHTTARGVPDAIIHRDIKPANIMRLNSGTSCMLDFGIARKENLSAGTQAKGTRAGSPVFQAPEMEKGGSGKPTARTDIYSLCATLYAMVSGEEDFPESRPDQLAGIRANIPNPDLQFILIKGTETDPAARWRNAEELFNRLARIYETLRPLPAHLAPPAPVVHHTAPVLAHQPTLTAPTLIPAPLPTPTIVQPAVHTPTQVVQPQQPKTRSMKVKWEKGKVAVYSQSEYQQKVVGKVVAGRPFMMKNDPVAGVMVTVTRIIDSGNPTNPVPATVDVITGSDGTFELQISDVTVPIEISKRTIYVQVEDSNGDAICHGDVDIKRPRQMGYKAAQAGAAVGNFFGGWVAAPWEWLKNTFSGFASRSVVVIGWIVAAVSAVLFIYGASTGKTWLWVIAPWGVANGMVAATIPKPETTLANGQKKKRLGTIRSLLYLFTAAAILLDYVFNFMPR